jgi:hypothetical protein
MFRLAIYKSVSYCLLDFVVNYSRKGFAFVQYGNPECVLNAISYENGLKLYGKPLCASMKHFSTCFKNWLRLHDEYVVNLFSR